MNRKLRAYTLVELLVVLILSSILLSAAMMLYTNVSRYQKRLQTRVEKLNSFDRFRYYLLNDAAKSSSISLSARGIRLLPTEIEYEFDNTSIRRSHGQHSERFPLEGVVSEENDGFEVRIDIYENDAVILVSSKPSYIQQWSKSTK